MPTVYPLAGDAGAVGDLASRMRRGGSTVLAAGSAEQGAAQAAGQAAGRPGGW